MELIRTFCGFSLAACAALLMLPEGALRRAASLAFGLMTSLLWLEGLTQAELPEISAGAPTGVLAASGTEIDQETVCEGMLSSTASAAAGCEVSVLVQDGEIVSITAFTDDEAAAKRAAEALSVQRGDVTAAGAR